MSNSESSVKTKGVPYPRVASFSPKFFLIFILSWIIIIWSLFFLFDIFEVFSSERILWTILFNDYPLEWTQWFVMVFAIVTAGFLSSQLFSEKRFFSSKFFLLFALGIGFMLIEDAGDIRHVISSELNKFSDNGYLMGIHYKVVSDLPYFVLLASLPLYATFRYGRYVWVVSKCRFPFLLGLFFYAIASIGSAFRHFNDFYINIGYWINENVLNNSFPIPSSLSIDRGHFLLVDSILEETIELLAISFIFLSFLIFVQEFRYKRLPKGLK